MDSDGSNDSGKRNPIFNICSPKNNFNKMINREGMINIINIRKLLSFSFLYSPKLVV